MDSMMNRGARVAPAIAWVVASVTGAVCLVLGLWTCATADVLDAGLVVRWSKPSGTLAQILMPILLTAVCMPLVVGAGIGTFQSSVGRPSRVAGIVATVGAALLALVSPWWAFALLPCVAGLLLDHRLGYPARTVAVPPRPALPMPGDVQYGPQPRYREARHGA